MECGTVTGVIDGADEDGVIVVTRLSALVVSNGIGGRAFPRARTLR